MGHSERDATRELDPFRAAPAPRVVKPNLPFYHAHEDPATEYGNRIQRLLQNPGCCPFSQR